MYSAWCMEEKKYDSTCMGLKTLVMPRNASQNVNKNNNNNNRV